MKITRNPKISISNIWLSLLVIYIMFGYIAQGVILPALLNSLSLYLFLGYSMVVILCSGKIKITPILKWELICLVLALVSMLYAPSFSLFSGTYYILIVDFILVFILTQMPWNESRFNMVIKTYVASAALLIILLAFTGNLADNSDEGRLGTELMGNANKLALMLTTSAMYAIWLLLSSKGSKDRFFLVIALAIIYYGMFLSGGRKFVIAPVLFLYFVLVNRTDKAKGTNIVKNTVLILVILFVLYLIIMKVPFVYEHLGYRFDGFFALFNDENNVDGSTKYRMMMIEAAWKKWLSNPIWGYGFDSFKYYNATDVTGHMYYSHNNFVELLYNQGIIGFIAYYSFYVFLYFSMLKMKSHSKYRDFILGCILTWLCFEFLAVTYSVTSVQIMLFLCYWCSANEKKKQALVTKG